MRCQDYEGLPIPQLNLTNEMNANEPNFEKNEGGRLMSFPDPDCFLIDEKLDFMIGMHGIRTAPFYLIQIPHPTKATNH